MTEPTTGTDTTSLKTTARKDGDNYIINGQKVWISRIEHSDLMLLLARTTDKEKTQKKTEGLSVFIIDVKKAQGNGLEIRPIESMINHHSCELFFDDLVIPSESLLGEEGKGFKVHPGRHERRANPDRSRVCWRRPLLYRQSVCLRVGSKRVHRPIGQNQGVQFPIARCYTEVEAASLMVRQGGQAFRCWPALWSRSQHGEDARLGASWKVGDVCMQTHGGFAFAKEYHIERKFRDQALPDSADLNQLNLKFRGRACTQHAPVVLTAIPGERHGEIRR